MGTGLRDEIRQKAPFASLEQEVFLNVVRTAATLEHSLAEGLKEYGLTPTQYNVLRILRGAGSRGLCRSEIGDRMLNPVPDVTRLLDRLVDGGLAARTRDSADRRFVRAQITREGLEVLAELDAPVRTLHEEQLGHLDATELRALVGLLEAARARGAWGARG